MVNKNFIYDILPLVSRTFALSIKRLKGSLRLWVSHAYLICRLLDTFEDDSKLSIKNKNEAIDRIIDGLGSFSNPDITKYANSIVSTEAELVLIKESSSLIETLKNYPEPVKNSIAKWAIEMAQGMKKFAFSSDRNFSIKTMKDLDLYCYYVAGTVGNMLTDLFSYCTGNKIKKQDVLLKNSENFGKALQLVNIIKDSTSDILEKRCFIPEELFEKYSIEKDDFFSGNDFSKINMIYKDLINQADVYINNAIEYTKAISIRFYRIRLFCIIPLVLARKTLNLLRNNITGLINNPGKEKISRKTVKRCYFASFFAGASNKVFIKMMR